MKSKYTLIQIKGIKEACKILIEAGILDWGFEGLSDLKRVIRVCDYEVKKRKLAKEAGL